ILAGIPYVTASPDEAVKLYERDYQAVIYVIFSLLGQFVQTEVQNAGGRADCVVHTQEVIYVFEFKLWSAGTPEKALEQIRTSGYALPYQSSGKRVLLVGVSFDDQKRTIGAWKVEEL
ncbi:MAG: PD-(D/E)XK nuclease domain-containing protein, partial [Bacteroides sp.]